MIRTLPLLFALIPAPLAAATLELPAGAELRAEVVDPAGRYALPLAPWAAGSGVKARETTGQISRQAWRLGGTGLSSFQILSDLRAQLESDGFSILFECSTRECGGFDFRYGTEVLTEPAMHVNLGDFHFLSAENEANNLVSLLVSRSASAAFVQVIQVGDAAPITQPVTSTRAVPGTALPTAELSEIGPAMESVGRYILADLVFETGSAALGPGDFTSLTDLAAYLKADTSRRVALVGHTDATGSLSGNVSLSKRRAESVMARLISDFGVPAAQLEADGIGYLAPIATNQTEEGRATNRRVEAILVSTR
ncbi:MAG: cell envelope biogenesis protein OmpA [Rhodobacterales bacterium]|nr:MAG: cell envelope biogenesis protein OmpA [Rhodobacterales bacterium]